MSTVNAEAVQRLRITFSQAGALRYVGHLDMVRTWERGLRRAGVPLAYSGGFNPGPRLYFASGLPLGATGRAEIVDVLLTEAMRQRHSWPQSPPTCRRSEPCSG
jgi:radical SAM-linked protein